LVKIGITWEASETAPCPGPPAEHDDGIGLARAQPRRYHRDVERDAPSALRLAVLPHFEVAAAHGDFDPGQAARIEHDGRARRFGR
jgi:hypothetical protein